MTERSRARVPAAVRRPRDRQHTRRADPAGLDGHPVAAQRAGGLVARASSELRAGLRGAQDDEIIIGEVKSRDPRSLRALDGLAGAVAKVPNAQLESHWLGDPVASAAPAAGIDPQDVLFQVNEARVLLRTDHVRAAALIAWSAVEGALLYHAARLDVPLQEDASSAGSPWQLLSYLDSRGYVSDTDLKRLTELRSERNAVAHFRGPGTAASREDTEYGLDFAERVLRGQYVSVD
jgi:hypothetical protein